MMDVPVYNMTGQQTGTMQVDEAALGGKVRFDLLKQAVVTWQANQRTNSARTKNRRLVVGSSRKLYKQKGTGNARTGNARNPIRRGGGRAFAKRERDHRLGLPKKMRQLARNSALLAKLKAGNVAVIESLDIAEPKTKVFFGILKALDANNGCVVALDTLSLPVVKSGRNIEKTEIRQVRELNAYEILRRRKLLFTRKALEAVIANPATYCEKN